MSYNKFLIDNLTGCIVPNAFSNEFEGMLSAANESYTDLTLVILDIDNFESTNEIYGYQTGDKILREVSEALLKIEGEHYVFRYSGDKFAILFPKMEKENAFLVMEDIRNKIRLAIICNKAKVTISAGIATYPEDGNKHYDVLRKAEDALYRAKSSGKNKVCLAKDEKLIEKTVYYSAEQLQRLKKLSEEINMSEEALMREAINELFKKHNSAKKLKRTVLIVEDAEFMRKMLREIMFKNNITVVGEAKDGEEAVGKFNELNPDFVLLNIVMPKMDGIDFLKAIEKKPKNIIIVLTAQGKKDILLKTIMYGADAFITIPFTPDYLINVMNDSETNKLNEGSTKIFEKELEDLDESETLSQNRIDEIRKKCF